MIYVALLRGINVGGRNKIDMKELKRTFERVGMKSVTTYINSGNVLFENSEHEKNELVSVLKEAIKEDYILDIDILIRSKIDFSVLVNATPDNLKNDKTMKCDVLFLYEEINNESILDELIIKPDIDTVFYVPGAVVWAADKEQVTKSGLMKLAGSALYKKMTIRNVNTARRIYMMMNELSQNKH